jgi:quercetin dioxygenase-like cupin family protein
MKSSTLFVAAVFVLALAGMGLAGDQEAAKKPDILSGTIPGLEVDNILTGQLEVAEGLEVVVSRIVIPPNTELPKHWHPGEEFGYVLDGSIMFWQEGKDEVLLQKGDVAKIPLQKVHNVRTTDSSATVLVFRVHKSGEPVRVLVE